LTGRELYDKADEKYNAGKFKEAAELLEKSILSGFPDAMGMLHELLRHDGFKETYLPPKEREDYLEKMYIRTGNEMASLYLAMLQNSQLKSKASLDVAVVRAEKAGRNIGPTYFDIAIAYSELRTHDPDFNGLTERIKHCFEQARNYAKKFDDAEMANHAEKLAAVFGIKL